MRSRWIVGVLLLTSFATAQTAPSAAPCEAFVTPDAATRTFPLPLSTALIETFLAYEREADALGGSGKSTDDLQVQVAGQLRRLIQRYGWPDVQRAGAPLNDLTWTLMGRVDDLDLRRCVLPLIRPTLQTDTDRRRYAELVDDTELAGSSQQIYGTRLRTSGYRVHLMPLRDAAGVEARRAELGLPPLAQEMRALNAERSLPLPPGLPWPVAVPDACQDFTTSEALNRPLTLAQILEMEARVDDLVTQDQDARFGRPGARSVLGVDQDSTEYVIDLLATSGWPSTNRAGAYLAGNVWLLVQHADLRSSLQLCVLKLIERQQSTVAERRNLAYLTDRVLVGRGELQVYGTQVTTYGSPEKVAPGRIRDPGRVDERRAAMGLDSLEEYLRSFQEFLKQLPSSR